MSAAMELSNVTPIRPEAPGARKAAIALILLGQDMARDILRELSDKEVELRCHPDDQEAMAALVPEALRHCGYSKQGEPVSIRVAQSREIERGGCILDFEEGSVDAQPSAALEVVIAAIHETLGGDA